ARGLQRRHETNPYLREHPRGLRGDPAHAADTALPPCVRPGRCSRHVLMLTSLLQSLRYPGRNVATGFALDGNLEGGHLHHEAQRWRLPTGGISMLLRRDVSYQRTLLTLPRRAT